MEEAIDGPDAIRALRDFKELRAVLIVNGREVDLHMSDLYGTSWTISECDQETKNVVIPVARRIYEALFTEGRYQT